MMTQAEHIILIVDDNPKNLQLLGNMLKEEGYKVEFATNGSEALEWLKEKAFDLILLDIMMPVMDGYRVCQTIRGKRQWDDMPVIFLTAKTDRESILKGFEAGAQDYVSKPFDMSELLARVSTHLELHDSRVKLREVNQWLEKEVADRTLSLEHANRQLSHLDKAKTEFLNLIGHELRTPLNGIIGPMQIIETGSYSKEVSKMLDLMKGSIERLEEFAYEALLITNLRTGKHKIKCEEISLIELIKKAENVNSGLMKQKGISLNYEIDRSVSIKGDRALMEKCISKLFESSLFHSVRDSEIDIDAYRQEGGVYITFSDAGSHFSDRLLKGLNNLFVPEGEYIDSNRGIGMVLVNLIMKEHDAAIWLDNLDDKGASVVLRFEDD